MNIFFRVITLKHFVFFIFDALFVFILSHFVANYKTYSKAGFLFLSNTCQKVSYHPFVMESLFKVDYFNNGSQVNILNQPELELKLSIVFKTDTKCFFFEHKFLYQ